MKNTDTSMPEQLSGEADYDPTEDWLLENARTIIEALIASVYLARTNTRRVKRMLFGQFEGAVNKDVVSRA